jgi:orotidine-5'-phosphate decarboxylase
MPINLGAKERIIVALDTQDITEVTATVRRLAPYVGMFKAGFELTEAVGTERAIRAIKAAGGKVFRDGKFLDIPNTVKKASQAVSTFGPEFFNLHIQAGDEAMKLAVAQKGSSQVLGVSVLTSLDPREILEMFVGPFVEMVGSTELGMYGYMMMTEDDDDGLVENAKDMRTEYVQRLVLGFAEKSAKNGLDGLICSPQELKYLKANGSPAVAALLTVVPGIRMPENSQDDQTRAGTPYQAILDGADYLVIGRPILLATDPVAAAQAIASEIERALGELNAA